MSDNNMSDPFAVVRQLGALIDDYKNAEKVLRQRIYELQTLSDMANGSPDTSSIDRLRDELQDISRRVAQQKRVVERQFPQQ